MVKKAVRTRSKLTDIHQNLAEILGVERLDQLVGLSRLRKLWPHIVGSMLAQRTEPIDPSVPRLEFQLSVDEYR